MRRAIGIPSHLEAHFGSGRNDKVERAGGQAVDQLPIGIKELNLEVRIL
jgi:hypothetical protein